MPLNRKLREFSSRFWDARKLAREKKTEEAIAAFQALIAFAREGGFTSEAEIAEAAIAETEGRLDDAIARVDATLSDSALKLTGLAHFQRGAILDKQEKYDQAIADGHKAITAADFDAPGYAWHGIGVTYGKKQDNDEAIRCYQQALETPGYDTPGSTWYNMGNAYIRKQDYEEAIRCYRQALETPGYDRLGNIWNNMGIAYRNKKDIDEAIRCYQQALETPGYDTPGSTWYNMGNAYAKKQDYGEAIRCYQQAEECYQQQGDEEKAALTRRLIDTTRIKPEQRSRKDQTLLEQPELTTQGTDDTDDPLTRMRARITMEEETEYQKYAKQESSQDTDVLTILKGWGSATPLIAGVTSECRGGGYFLKWDGSGMVIDPGYDFLHNFMATGFHLREAKVVAVSHNHPDHNQDLKAIDDLRYELWKATGQNPEWGYVLLSDKDTDTHIIFDPVSAPHRPDPLVFDIARSRRGLGNSLDLRANDHLPFEISYFEASHTSDVPHAVGLRVSCYPEDGEAPAFVLGYSADTGYYDGLCDDKCLGHCDLLIAHVSQPDEEEFNDQDHLKATHLGLRGAVKLITGCAPKLTIISEFWSGLADIRLDLVKELRRACPNRAILPGSIGLRINPREMTVRCTCCGKYCPCAEINVGAPTERFGPLKYYCPHCRM